MKRQAFVILTTLSLLGLTTEASQRQAETGRFHFIEKVSGLSFVCLDSLVRAISIDQATDPPANNIHKILNQSQREEDR
jgi:hypothetical protein